MTRKLLTSATTQETQNIELQLEKIREQVRHIIQLYRQAMRAQRYRQIARRRYLREIHMYRLRSAIHRYTLPRYGRIARETPEPPTVITKRGKTFRIVHTEPFITAELFISEALTTELLFREYAVPLFTRLEIEQIRRHRTREELIEREFEVTRLEPPFHVILDVTELARYEADLYKRYGKTLEELLMDVIEMCSFRQTFLKQKLGLEALQKALLQLYVPYFHARPYTMNLLSIRVTPKTLVYLLNYAVTYYIYGCITYQMLKLKAIVKPCEKRRQETKLMASSSGCGSTRPVKFSQGYTDTFTGNEKVGIPKDTTGKELLWMGLRYAYSMPYWLRRFIAIHMGMPENHKYARYFGIGCIPSRRKTRRKYERHFPEAQYLHYSVDKQIMDAIKRYRKRHRETYPERGKRRYRRRI